MTRFLILLLCALPLWASELGFLLGGDATGFRKASREHPLRLPLDHGAHPDYRSEWWYLTGHLKDEQGREYGLQWTLFRQGIRPGEAASNPWRIPQIWLAQAAITDLASGRHLSDERISRQGPGLAGASRGRYWLRDWALIARGDDLFPATLTVSTAPFTLDLAAIASKPAVLQGDGGYSEKSPGNASYYYSYPRLSLRGTLTLDGEARTVLGQGWFDHEWSSSVLAQWQAGWDWFSLQLDDGRELMLFRLRTKAGRTEPESRYAVVIERDGRQRQIPAGQIRFIPGKVWRGPKGEAYPIEWRLKAGDLNLTIRARQASQAMSGRFNYWEGAVSVSGDASGLGYLEMTGY